VNTTACVPGQALGPGCQFLLLVAVFATGPACSLKTYAINMVGDALSAGDSVYETDDDLELVGAALPFGLKLTESLLAQSPGHRGLLLTACRGFTVYAFAYVGHAAEITADEDLDRARAVRIRARRLYLRRVWLLHARARALVSGADRCPRQGSGVGGRTLQSGAKGPGPALDHHVRPGAEFVVVDVLEGMGYLQ
jgi:hypothetical protein